MRFAILPVAAYHEYEQIFRATFNNPDIKRVIFQNKLKGYGRLRPIALAAYAEHKIIVSLLTIYPQYYQIGDKEYLGGQIGDALTVENYRGKGIFKELVKFAMEIAKNNSYDFLLTFPSKKNKGSYLSFIGNGWQMIAPIIVTKKYTKVNLLPRILRKIGEKYYLRHEKKQLAKISLPDSIMNLAKQGDNSGVYDYDYFQSKVYNSKYFLKLPSGQVYISVSSFHITLGLYKVKKGKTLNEIVVELMKICQHLGKDYLACFNSMGNPSQYKTLSGKQEENLVALVYSINPNNNFQSLNFTAADIDTF